MPHLTIKGATEEKLTFCRVLKKSFLFQVPYVLYRYQRNYPQQFIPLGQTANQYFTRRL
jgi:hypothetical protein